MHDAPDRRAVNTKATDLAIPHELGCGADSPIIVQGLHDRTSCAPTNFIDGRRKQWKEIMNVNNIWLEVFERPRHCCDANRVFDRPQCRERFVKIRRYCIIRNNERTDIMPGRGQEVDLPLKNGVFSTGLLISIVCNKNLHAAS